MTFNVTFANASYSGNLDDRQDKASISQSPVFQKEGVSLLRRCEECNRYFSWDISLQATKLYEKNIDQSKGIFIPELRTRRTQISQGFTSSLQSPPPASPLSSNSNHKKRSRKFLPKGGGNGGRGDSGSKRTSSIFPSVAEVEENA